METKSPNESGPNGLPRRKSRIVLQRALSSALYELQLDRAGLTFSAGDEILLHGPTPELDRTYSIASGEDFPTVRILYRRIPNGARTPELSRLRPGTAIDFTGPTGSFQLNDPSQPAMFIATGTGIAPALSYLASHPQLPITILHGVREPDDLVYNEWLGQAAYIPCISGPESGRWYSGRVTQHLLEHPISSNMDVYLCGSNSMIEDARDILTRQDHDPARIFTEPYYYW